MDHCEKIQGGRLPTVRSLTEQEALYGRVDEVLYVNDAKQKESGTTSFAAWVPINQINGTWVELYNKTSQELQMLSSVALKCKVTKIVMNSDFQLSSVSQMSQVMTVT